MNGWRIISLNKDFDPFLMQELKENQATSKAIITCQDPLTISFNLKWAIKQIMTVPQDAIFEGIKKGMIMKYPDFVFEKDYNLEIY
jgi:hypothetical protein